MGINRLYKAPKDIDTSAHFLRPLCNNMLVFIYLGITAGVLYFPQATRMGLSQDGFLLTYFMQTGDLLVFNFDEVKEPGRPFLGLSWHLAAILSGGSVVGYNLFMFFCIMASAILIYIFLKTLLPRQPIWALLGSTLKLVWSANFEVFDNSCLAIYFAESLFWLACWLFARLTLQRVQLSRLEVFFTSLAMTTSLFIIAGTYQTSWPVVLLVPPALIALVVLNLRNRQTYLPLSLWYLATLPMIFWCYVKSYQFATQVAPPLPEIFKRLLVGLWATTGESLIAPFAPADAYPKFGVSTAVLLSLLVFAILLIRMSKQSSAALYEQSYKQIIRVLTLLLCVSLVIMVGSLLPPLILYTPKYGTRFIHWPAIGTILGVVTVLAGLYRIDRWIGATLSTILAVVLVSGMTQLTYNIGNHYGSNGFLNRRFWEDVSVEISNIDEGTIILIDGPPLGIATVDRFSTFVLRALTETHSTFFITDTKPEFDLKSQTYKITTDIDLNHKQSLTLRHSHYDNPVFPMQLTALQTFQVPAYRVIWVSWDSTIRGLQIIPERSSMERLHRHIPSVWGEMLFPRATIEQNRSRDNNPPL